MDALFGDFSIVIGQKQNEKLHDHRHYLVGKLVAAGMDVGHDRRPRFGRIQSAVFSPGLAVAAAVELPQFVDGSLLPLELHQRILFARLVQYGLGLELPLKIEPGGRRTGCDRRERVPAFRPEQIGEGAAVRVPGGVHPLLVDFEVLFHGG
jgi:hypothetical protein